MNVARGSQLCFVLAVLASPLPAANFSGKWALSPEAGPAAGRGGAMPILVLNQVGTEVAGAITPPRGVSTGSPTYTEILGGQAGDDTISFYIWTGLDKPVKSLYQGRMAGDEIVFTVTVDPATRTANNPPQPLQIRAKRTR